MICYNMEYLTALRAMDVHFSVGGDMLLATMQVKPSLKDKIRDAQEKYSHLQKMKTKVQEGKNNQFIIQDDGMLLNGKRICVLDVEELRTEIMHEAHYAPYAMHPGSTKMYRDLRPYYWWPTMKKDVAEFVARCLTCQQVKAEHQAPAGKLHPLTIPEWKWEKGSLGALDGMYIDVCAKVEDRARYRTRKGSIAVNVLGVCDRDMRFIYVLGIIIWLTVDTATVKGFCHHTEGFVIISKNLLMDDDASKGVCRRGKKTYGCINDMIGRTGFGWCQTTNTIDVKDDVFDNFAKTLRYKSFPYYAQWCEVFGKDRATGEHGFDPILAPRNPSDTAEIERSENVPVTPEYYVPTPDPSLYGDDDKFMNSFASIIAQPTVNRADTERVTSQKRKMVVTDIDDKFDEKFEAFINVTDSRLGDIAKRFGMEAEESQARKQSGVSLNRFLI
ncbi:UNVERIFIED_CONTAM: hypothetical protein Sradi_4904300 [Sesamum radiatum]|uniref:Integrase zinc-binding domain-containing protein n=1 Tax=Sesamum radiatum TaxID=300843 RepID=A0AAW2MDI1_SESRA